jgi:DNA-binding transcriptional LysR family regulator
MTDITDVQLRRLDATLLVVFCEALRTGRLSIVAGRLGLTQSAVSHAVQRLREIFDDPLFLRRPNGVEPTPRARALGEPLNAALAQLRAALESGRAFEPTKLRRVFRVGTLDYTLAVVGPAIVGRLARLAPECAIVFASVTGTEALKRLREGADDLAVGVYPDPPAGMVATPLMSEHFVTIARQGNPMTAAGLDLDAFCRLDHVLVSGSGDLQGVVDLALRAVGRKRRVVASMPQFLAAFASVAASDAIATVPERLARRYAARFGLRAFATPIDVRGFELVALRGPGSANDRAIAWLVELLRDGNAVEKDASRSHDPVPAAKSLEIILRNAPRRRARARSVRPPT